MSRKLIAILRGIEPSEVEAITEGIIDSGIHWIEVPLNSPDALISIGKIAKRFGADCHIGAGTVINRKQVSQVSEAGGSFIVSPNCDPAVIGRTKSLEMASYPGVFTVSECYSALEAGADGLKIFPASIMGTSGVSAIRAVLPADTKIYAVGGVDETNMNSWMNAGVDGFGIGSALYKPGRNFNEVIVKARAFVDAYDNCSRSVDK